MAGVLAVGAIDSRATLYQSGAQSGGTIFDNNGSGSVFKYDFGATGAGATITSLTVNLNISGGFNGDLYAYLTHDGATAILLNRIGTTGAGTFGNSQAGMNVTFNDSGAFQNIHPAGQGTLASGGTYGSDGNNVSPYNLAGMNSQGGSANLTGFAGHTLSGGWTLFISDVDGGGGDATLNSWSMDINVVPEPVNVALGIFGGCFAVLHGVRYWKRKQALAV